MTRSYNAIATKFAKQARKAAECPNCIGRGEAPRVAGTLANRFRGYVCNTCDGTGIVQECRPSQARTEPHITF